jgi:voltage-gated potassium channel
MNKYNKMRAFIFKMLEVSDHESPIEQVFNIFLISLISLNVIAIIAESIQEVDIRYKTAFRIFEVISVMIFSVEYLLRIWTATEHAQYRRPILGRIRYIFSPLALIDLTAILPFYIPLIIPLDLRFLRAVRLIRLFRVFKLGRYSESLKTLAAVFRAKRQDLFITAFAVLILLIISSSMMYLIENNVQPKAFSSIPAAMWWGVATLTTVGYGDVYPITIIGKLLGAVIAILGIGLFALPAGILGSGFVEIMQKKKQDHIICPHCGKPIDK